MELNTTKKGRRKQVRSQSLEALISAIDQQVDQIPPPTTAEGFAAFLGGDAADFEKQKQQYIRFLLNGYTFALPLKNTLEIDYVPDIVTLPNIPKWILGICNLRGDVVSVVDLNQILNLSPRGSDTPKKLILIRNKEISTAIIVDSISGMLFADTHDNKKSDTALKADEQFTKFLKNTIISGRQTIYLLDLDVLMAALEL